MSFLSFLYHLLITPLMLLFEVIFTIANRLIGNEGLSIIVLSIAVNFLVLPLYKRADELQAEERDIQAKMAYRVKRIKQTFKGNEQFLMLQEYYSMKLVVDAEGITDYPKILDTVELKDEDRNLSALEKRRRAIEVLFNKEYYSKKAALTD